MKYSTVIFDFDYIIDAQTAQSAGVAFAAVATGTTPAEEFANYPCTGIYSSLTALAKQEIIP